MNSNMLISYIRDPNNAPTGVVVALSKDKIGWSLLNSKMTVDFKIPLDYRMKPDVVVNQDKWDKHKAFDLAIKRAHAAVDWSEKIREKLDELDTPLSPRTRDRFADDLLPTLERMKDRAKRYYKEKN